MVSLLWARHKDISLEEMLEAYFGVARHAGESSELFGSMQPGKDAQHAVPSIIHVAPLYIVKSYSCWFLLKRTKELKKELTFACHGPRGPF